MFTKPLRFGASVSFRPSLAPASVLVGSLVVVVASAAQQVATMLLAWALNPAAISPAMIAQMWLVNFHAASLQLFLPVVRVAR